MPEDDGVRHVGGRIRRGRLVKKTGLTGKLDEHPDSAFGAARSVMPGRR